MTNYVTVIAVAIVFLAGFSVTEFTEAESATHDERETDEVTEFDDLFSHERSVAIEGTDEHPIFEITSLAANEEVIVLVDRTIPALSGLNEQGEVLYQVGQDGEGPGDFRNPAWVGFDQQGRVASMENISRPRFQFFSPEDGEHLDVMSSNIMVTGNQAFFEGEAEDQRVTFPTRATCPDRDEQQCVIEQHAVETGDVTARFAAIDELDENLRGLPWVLGRDEHGYSYVTHENGGPLVGVFDSRGQLAQKIEIDDSPALEILEYSTMPMDDVRDFWGEITSRTFSNFYSIEVHDGHIVLDHEWNGGENDGDRHLSIFSTEGEFITATPPIDYELHYRDGDRFFFVENVDPRSELGKYKVHEYRYQGG